MTDQMPEPIEAATATPTPEPTGPQPAGKLEPMELAQLSALRQKGMQLTLEVGRLEVRKVQLLRALDAGEQQAQQLLNSVGQRLGLKEGQMWQVGADGSILLVESPPAGEGG